MTHFAKNSLAAFAAIFLTVASVGAVVTVPPVHASPIATQMA